MCLLSWILLTLNSGYPVLVPVLLPVLITVLIVVLDLRSTRLARFYYTSLRHGAERAVSRPPCTCYASHAIAVNSTSTIAVHSVSTNLVAAAVEL